MNPDKIILLLQIRPWSVKEHWHEPPSKALHTVCFLLYRSQGEHSLAIKQPHYYAQASPKHRVEQHTEFPSGTHVKNHFQEKMFPHTSFGMFIWSRSNKNIPEILSSPSKPKTNFSSIRSCRSKLTRGKLESTQPKEKCYCPIAICQSASSSAICLTSRNGLLLYLCTATQPPKIWSWKTFCSQGMKL